MPDTARTARRQPADVRREQLLGAAEAVMVTKGFDATSVADVAAAAGLAKGTVYLHFGSKAELLAALRARYLQQFGGALEESQRRAGARDPARRLACFVEELFAFSTSHVALHHVLFHEAGFSEEDAFVGARRLLGAIVDEGVAAGQFRVPEAGVAAAFVLHGVHGVLVEALHSPSMDAERAKQVAVAIALRAVGAG
ncbi:MAG TPA: TetR/AcrR family transcriptional regulator [Acidimicrobiales bacterium]|nr:TetR/AcrR family transcriptional regulator [Acidimicrobiales bacterium]